jgi:hypothetical protein
MENGVYWFVKYLEDYYEQAKRKYHPKALCKYCGRRWLIAQTKIINKKNIPPTSKTIREYGTVTIAMIKENAQIILTLASRRWM